MNDDDVRDLLVRVDQRLADHIEREEQWQKTRDKNAKDTQEKVDRILAAPAMRMTEEHVKTVEAVTDRASTLGKIGAGVTLAVVAKLVWEWIRTHVGHG